VNGKRRLAVRIHVSGDWSSVFWRRPPK
jgi:hypothetical protein